MIKEAVLYKRLPNDRVKCIACTRYWNISKGKIGFCGVRQNIGDKLYLLVYGKIIADYVDPIEKKPIIHYLPGSKVFSIGTTGCNWLCQYCQNYNISQCKKVEGTEVSPKEVVQLAEDYGCQGIAYTYNEPTIYIEYAHDIGEIAREKGLINIFVSNGYCTLNTVKMMNNFLDCIVIDFKGNGETNFLKKYVGVPNVNPIFQTLLDIKDKTKIHIEITNLIIPKIGDNLEEARKLSKWLYENLGPDTPIHFLRFQPNYKLTYLHPTPVETLERHYDIAKEVGLRYVYVGNVLGHKFEHTYCPGCNRIVVKRIGWDITGWYLNGQNRCIYCGYKIPIVGKLNRTILSSNL